MDVQVDLVAYDGVGRDADIGEETVPPVSLHSIRHLVAGYGDGLSFGES